MQHVPVDLSIAEGPGRLVSSVLAGGPLEILVNNVRAVSPRPGGFLSVTDEQWARSLS